MLATLDLPVTALAAPAQPPYMGCQWWNLLCQGGEKVAESGLGAITQAIAAGATMLLGEMTNVIAESTQVPLADPVYRGIYYGFLGLAVPIIGVMLLGALVVAGIRRDAGTLVRAVSGLVVATLGGALYIAFAQFLIALDDWLSQGIVEVTGQSLPNAISELAEGFDRIAGTGGTIAANMLLIILMMVMIIAGLGLWFVLVLRQICVLVVVAFAPLLIVGWLWAPTRSWVRRTTEVLVALIFTKSALFALFGIGLALLFRNDGQSLSDFVGAVILLCGSCFAPLVMLKLVHFATDSHLAGEMMGTLRGGVTPVTSRMPSPASMTRPIGRFSMAREYAGGPLPQPAYAGAIGVGPGHERVAPGTTTASTPEPQNPASAAAASPGSNGSGGPRRNVADSGAPTVSGAVGTPVVVAAATAQETKQAATYKGTSVPQELTQAPPGEASPQTRPRHVNRLSGPTGTDQQRTDHGGEAP